MKSPKKRRSPLIWMMRTSSSQRASGKMKIRDNQREENSDNMDEKAESMSEIVVERSFRRVIFVAAFALIAIAALMVMSSEPAEAYTVVATETWVVPTSLNEDLIIAPGGVLNLQTELYMQLTFDGEYEVRVQAGGTLNMNGGTITRDPLWPPVYYEFWMDVGSIGSYVNSLVEYAGGGSQGMWIETSALTFDGLTVTNNQFAGIYYTSDVGGFTMNNCDISNNGAVGLYISDSATTDYVFNFLGGTRFNNNNQVGVYSEWLVDTSITMNFQGAQANSQMAGVYLDGVQDAFAALDFQSSDISFNSMGNVMVNGMVNSDLAITALGSVFESSSGGPGIYVDNMGGPLGANLTVRVYQSFVLNNAGPGIYVGSVTSGFMTFDFVDSLIETNGWIVGGDGVYIPQVAPGNQLTFTALRTSFSNNADYGVYTAGANPGSILISIDTCGFFVNGGYGLDIGAVVQGGLDVAVVNSYFEGNGFDAINVRGLNGGFASIVIDNNSFNNSWAAVYLSGTFETIPGTSGMFTFTFTNNWLNADWGQYGVYFQSNVQYFDEIVITVDNNFFWGMESRDFGLFFNGPIIGDFDIWQNLTLSISGNEFVGLDEAAGFFNQAIFGFRNIDITISGNFLWDTDFDYDLGFVFWQVTGDFGFDTSLNVASNGNVYVDLGFFPFYIHSERFRHVYMDFSNNIFVGNGWTQYGIIIDGFEYGTTGDLSDTTLIFDNNEMYDLVEWGIFVGAWGMPISKDLNMIFTNNHFNGSAFGTFRDGIYFGGSFYYTNGEDSSYNLLMDNNEFVEMTNSAVYFEAPITDFSDVNLEFRNNLFENRMNIWMDYGIVFANGIWFSNNNLASAFTLTLDSNEFYDLNNDALVVWGTIGGFRNVTFVVERNVFENRMSNYMEYGINIWGGFYYDTNDYDNFIYYSIRENTFRDLNQDGIRFDSWSPTYGFRHVDIQIHDNLFENQMDPNNLNNGIYWYYEVFYTTSMYDSSLNIDITGNVFNDISQECIAFRNNWGWEFGQFANATVNIQDNVFINSVNGGMDNGIYLRPIWIDRSDLDNSLSITIVNNTFDSLMVDAIHFASFSGREFEGYRNVNVLISQNFFYNNYGNWMDTGVALQGFEFFDSSYANTLYIEISNNDARDLTSSGFSIGGPIYYYSTVEIITNDNYFSDVYNNFNNGIYFSGQIYYTSANDGYFHFTSIRNQFFDLAGYGVYFGSTVYDFRNVTIQVQDSIFVNRIGNWMDHGVYFQDVFYNDDSYDNYFTLVITANIYENLTNYGFRINQIDNFRNVDIDIMDNYFSDVYNNFNYGVYFDSNVYYSTNFEGTFSLAVTGNTFLDLNSRGIYFANDIGEFTTVLILVDNNIWRNTISNWMDDGIYFNTIYYWDTNFVTNFQMDVTNNVFENLTYSGIRINSQVYYYQYLLINVNNNHFSDIYNNFDYGVYFANSLQYTTDYDSDLTVNAIGNTVLDLTNTGIRFNGFNDYRNVTVTVDNNDFLGTISNWLDYGFFISGVSHDGYLDFTNVVLTITNNRFENLTQSGFYNAGIYEYRYVTIDAMNNYFSDIYSSFDNGLYFTNGIGLDDASSDGVVRINVLNNEFRNLYWWGYGVYFSEIYNYRQAYVYIDSNDFFNSQQYSRLGYGIYFDEVYYDSDMYDTYLWANVTNNHLENMYERGITIYEVYGYRTVYMDFLDNSFSDLYNTFNYGIYTYYIYYNTDFDSTLRLNILRNTFTDLSSRGFYNYEIYDFRTTMVTAEYNDFVNTISNWMDYGMYFSYIYYDESVHDASLYFDVNYNTFQNLSNRGVYVSEIWDIRNVFMNFHFNQFSDVVGSFNYGVYIGGAYYTDSFPGMFDLFISNNTFHDLISYSFYLSGVEEYLDTDMTVQDNDFSRSDYGFYIDDGVDYADTWDLLFTRNNGDDMEDYMLYLGSTSYGTDGRSAASITVTENTMSSSWNGFYLGDIYYYDLSNMVLIENNMLLDMRNGYGIEFGWYAENDAYILIQGNTITGNMWAAMYFSGFEDQAFVLDINNNGMTGVQNAIYLEEPVYGDDMFTVGVITISQNDILDLTGYGVYIDYIYWGLMDLDITNNAFRGDPLAYYGVTFFYFDYADWNSISDIDITNNVFQDAFYGFYFDYQGSGSIITLEMDHAYVTNTFYTFYFDDPVSSSSDVFNVKIKKSIFTNSQLSFFYLDDPGYGLYIVTITDCEVINYGSLGGYGFYMAQNDGAFIRMDVYSTQFVGSSARLGDAFAGSGQLLLNFWYIDGITSGVSNGWNQRIQVLWDVDVDVMIGYDYTTPAGPGIVVYVDDQFGYQSFYTTTGAGGTVLGETVAGTLITYTGTSFSGQAVHTFWATQGPFSGSAVGAFNANGSISILLPGDNDGDGLHDGIDIDDDNDGVPDIYDDFPYDPLEVRDTDGDGIGNANDTDDDGDGVPDTADAFPDNPSEWSDIDGDGVGDNTDIDIDGDGIPNISDTSPYNNTGFMDSDGDSVADTVDVFPYNPHEWFDNDGDGLGNNADADDDNDGVPDEIDMYPFDPTRMDTRADEQVNIDISKGTDLVTIMAVLFIGLIVIFLLLFVFKPKKEEEDEGIPPKRDEQEAPTDDELSAELEEILGEEPEEF
jgi:hypothetical protein